MQHNEKDYAHTFNDYKKNNLKDRKEENCVRMPKGAFSMKETKRVSDSKTIVNIIEEK